MTADDVVASALRRLVSDDGAIHTATLPGPVTDAMQWIVDHCEHRCLHVAAADGLPPAALPKLCVTGVPMIFCTQATCVADCMQAVTLWRGVRVRDDCVMCGRQPTAFRTVFEDQAAGLSMVAWLCRDEVSKLASWVGLP